MHDLSHQRTQIDKLNLTTSQRVVSLINILILIAIVAYLIAVVWFAIENDSKVAGNFLALLSVSVQALPIILLIYAIWRNPNLLAKISTIFWSIGVFFLVIILLFFVGIFVLNSTFNIDIFSFTNLKFFKD